MSDPAVDKELPAFPDKCSKYRPKDKCKHKLNARGEIAEDNFKRDTKESAKENNFDPPKGKKLSRRKAKRQKAARRMKYRLGNRMKRKWNKRKKIRKRNKRDQVASYGMALAPNNTNQFLLSDRKDVEAESTKKESEDTSFETCLDFYEYDGAAFIKEYDRQHDEYLNQLSCQQLAEQWIELEDQIEAAEKRLADFKDRRREKKIEDAVLEVEATKIRVFREEIHKLYVEIADLELENEQLEELLAS